MCLFLLGTPSEVRWLSPEEKKMARARIMANNTGHDRTGRKTWKWKQVRECLADPCVGGKILLDMVEGLILSS